MSTSEVFGAVHLGYVVVQTERFTDWRRFGRDAVGMHLDDMQPNAMRFRLDDHQCRVLVQRGPAEDITTLGWHFSDHDALNEVLSRVSRYGVPTTEGTPDEAAQRGVERLVRIPGPNGLAQELFTRPNTTDEPLSMPARRFITGGSGMGHVAVTSKKPHRMRGYYTTLFDARLTDYIDETVSGVKLKIRFLRVNQRHHSIAIAALNRLPINPIRTRVQHLNVQVADLDDMTAAYQRMRELGFRIALTVGQHTNDKELSFYAVTPSGFEWEVGWNPIVIDEATWEPTTHRGISSWGHTREGQTIIDKLHQFRTGARSIFRYEDPVPALAGAGLPDD